MTSFVDSFEYQELLNISKQHRDAVDEGRVFANGIAGVDNMSTLKVSTVFAAISIEAALNDYILAHCLFLDTSYLQSVFGDITKSYLWAPYHKKIKVLRDHWPNKFPQALLQDIEELFRIRNLVTHRTHEFFPATHSTGGGSVMRNRPMTVEESHHMLRHHDIAYDFLSRFWLPGNRELDQPPRLTPPPP